MRVILSKLGGFGAACGTALLMISAGPSLGQSAARIGGPAELPPAGFTGQQYVDSRGCIFMRAGLAGQVNWVPRIGADRKPICAQVTPAQAAKRLQGAAAQDADAGAEPAGAPLRTIASEMKSTPSLGLVAPIPVPGLTGGPAAGGAPLQAAAPIAAAQTPPAPQISGVSTGCPAAAPKLEYIALNTGGRVAVCTRGDGTATGWVSPQFTPASGPGAALRMTGQAMSSGKAQPNSAALQAAQATLPAAPPKGYQAAWRDDRLNPNRAKGTQAGWQSQAQVWTNTVPAKLAPPAQAAAQNTDIALATRTQDTGQNAQGLFVQVGTFGQPSNAQNAAARLSGLGMPVATSKGARGGKALVAVLAGPFASVQQAQAALSSLRSAGFADAFLR